MAKVRKRILTNYQINETVFALIWQSSHSMDQVMEKLAAYAAKHGLPPMPKAIASSRASLYRDQGVKLKFFPRGRQAPTDLNEVNKLISKVKAGDRVDLPPP